MPTTDATIAQDLRASLKLAAEKAPRSLVTKLTEVMAAVERIAKRGRNDHFQYDFATEADIAAAIRKELASRRVMLLPGITADTRTEIGKTSSGAVKALTQIDMTFTFLDGDTGDTLERPWKGVGVDTEDKGLYKAMTGGEKYFLLKAFLIPTGDDPEREGKDSRATAKADKDTKKARPALPPESGAVYVEKVVPRTKGNKQWADVVFSTGETLFARAPQLIALCGELAQGTQAVIVETHQNEKGHTELDMVRRWPERNETEENALLDAQIAQKEVGF